MIDIEVCQEIIRATIKAAALPGRHLNTGGLIAFLDDTKKYLERCFYSSAPENYLPKVEPDEESDEEPDEDELNGRS